MRNENVIDKCPIRYSHEHTYLLLLSVGREPAQAVRTTYPPIEQG